MEDDPRPKLRSVPDPEPLDPRVTAVLEVLAGDSVAAVAERWSVEQVLVERWVHGFVDAGTALVTNRPGAEAAMQRDRFLTAFAHELRTPLAVAQGWVAMLAEDEVPPDAVQGTVRRLQEALTRLAERTLDVELLAQASLGRLRVAPQLVSVDELTANLPGLTGVGGEGGGLEIEVDPSLFPRVLRDLWQAGSSRPQPRSLHLEVKLVDPWVELRVVREADPIDPQVLQALFEPFDLNDDGTGVTIGLYLARALTVAHGGTIGVEQDERSAVLWVRVPLGRPVITQA